MGYVLVTDSELEDIGDAIRAKTGGNSNLTLTQMASAIGGLPSKPVQYRFGSFSGNTAGNTISSLSVSVSAYSGEKCFIVVMHRTAINTPNGWSLNHYSLNAQTNTQGVSVFSKLYQSASSETVTISKTDNTDTSRICAFPIYFNGDVTLGEPISQAPDSGVEYYQYTITATDDLYLAVASEVWAGDAVFSINPVINSIPNNYDSVATRRLFGFVVGTYSTNTVFVYRVSSGTDQIDNNRLFLYKITQN